MIYLACIEYSSDPTTILAACLNPEKAIEIADEHGAKETDPNRVGYAFVYAMEDGTDYNWSDPPVFYPKQKQK